MGQSANRDGNGMCWRKSWQDFLLNWEWGEGGGLGGQETMEAGPKVMSRFPSWVVVTLDSAQSYSGAGEEVWAGDGHWESQALYAFLIASHPPPPGLGTSGGAAAYCFPASVCPQPIAQCLPGGGAP